MNEDFIIRDRTQAWDINLHHWSHSQDTTFRQCKRKWWWSKGLGLTGLTDKPALAKGSAIHYALEQFHTVAVEDRKLEILQHAFSTYWAGVVDRATYPEDMIRWGEQVGHPTMKGIWEHYGQDEGIPTDIYTEFSGTAQVPGSDVPFVYKADGLVIHPLSGPPYVLESKTKSGQSGGKYGISEDTMDKWMEEQHLFDLQTARYLWCIGQDLGVKVNHVVYNFIAFKGLQGTQPGRLKRKIVEFSEAEKYAAIHDVGVTANEASRPSLQIYPTFTKDCRWSCDFFDLCQVKKFGKDPNADLEAGFEFIPQDAVSAVRVS